MTELSEKARLHLISGFSFIVSLILILVFYKPWLFPEDYYVSKVKVEFGESPRVEEYITFHVMEKRFSVFFKQAYVPYSWIFDIECPSGFHEYTEEIEGGVEIGCKKEDGFIQPGDYTLIISYNPDVLEPLKWVSFSLSDRPVKKVETNGYLIFKDSLLGEPVVVFEEEPKLSEAVVLYLDKIIRFLPFLIPFFFLWLFYDTYNKYGRELGELEVYVYHTIPNEERKPWDVALFFRGEPGSRDVSGVAADVISSAVVYGSIKGVLEIDKDGSFKVEDGESFNRIFSEELREVLTYLSGKRVKSLMPEEVLENVIKPLVKFKAKRRRMFYDDSGEKRVNIVIAFLFIFVLLLTAIVQNFISYGIDPPTVSLTLIIFEILTAFILFNILKGYVFGRYVSESIYKEAVLWRGFENLLRNQSMMEKYGPEDKLMWGMWLAYAYAFGIPKKIIKFIVRRYESLSGKRFHYFLRFRDDIAYALSKVESSSRRGMGRHFGGFVGGGRFGMR